MTTTATRERPILFSPEMVCAILDGRKTQTRRVIKPQPTCGCPVAPEEMSATTPEGWQTAGHSGQWWCPCCTGDWQPQCPYGQPGDALWVKETYSFGKGWDGVRANFVTKGEQVWYHADGATVGGDQLPSAFGRIRPSIFMVRWASRLTLTVTDVRVQRVQEISEQDATAEGFTVSEEIWGGETIPAARLWFMKLWDSINGKRPGCDWNSNPWVWAITFAPKQES